MNAPSGFTLDSAGKIIAVDPSGVIFNKAMPLQALHMIVAAYVVGGFLIASVYAMGLLRGRRDRYHRLGFLIPFTVAIIFAPIQMVVGDRLARWVYNNQPEKFAAIELVPTTVERRARDAARPPQLGRHGHRRAPDPRVRVMVVRPADGTATVVQGLDSVPDRRAADDPRGERRPPRRGTSWSVWARCCSCSRSGSGSWLFRRDMPQEQAGSCGSPRPPASSR